MAKQTSSGSSGAEGNLGAAAADAAEQVQEQAVQLVDQVRQQVVTQLTTQKERAAGGLETAALLIRQASEHVRQQGQAPIAGYIETAADRVASAAQALREREVPQLAEETQELARRRPGLFLGGGLALGFLATRFFKSSTPPPQPQGTTDYSGTTGYGGATGYGGTTGYDYSGTTGYGAAPTSGAGAYAAGYAGTAGATGTATPLGNEEMLAEAPLGYDEAWDSDAAPGSLSEAMAEARLEGGSLTPADYAADAGSVQDTEER